MFIDEASIHVVGGDGGAGCVAFRREKFVPRGGPSGGDGGHGGTVFLVADERLNTLHHLRHQPRFAAPRGRHGEGSNRTGRSGEDRLVTVPIGTIVRHSESGELLGELLADGERLRVAAGGRGGRGNARFATATRRAPRYAQPGEDGEERSLRLELKLLADVGLVGLPNAGKSTLIAALSAARPKVADYPFTTLVPQLGVVADSREWEDTFVIADLPGLIAGASEGSGLGFQFLRHVERCRVLVHLVDLATPEIDVVEAVETIEGELRAFDAALLERPSLLVGSKTDAALDERRTALIELAKRRGVPLLLISSATRSGLGELTGALRQLLAAGRKAEADG